MTQESTESLQSITDKRRALESLIQIASGVENQQAALSELALAARPSQEFPPKVVCYFKAIEAKTREEDSTGLLQKLEKIENAVARSIEKILLLAKVDINKLRRQEIDKLDINIFNKFIDDFKRRTNTSLGLRYILKKRGMAIAPIKIPLQQEAINEQIEALKEKEKRCIKQIRTEIQVIINDTDKLLKQPDLPEAMKAELENVKQAMLVNVDHLDKGGSVSSIPNVFETVTLESDALQRQESLEEQTEAKTIESETPNESTRPQIATQIPETVEIHSNWWIFKKWLSSPWSTSWRSLKEKYGAK